MDISGFAAKRQRRNVAPGEEFAGKTNRLSVAGRKAAAAAAASRKPAERKLHATSWRAAPLACCIDRLAHSRCLARRLAALMRAALVAHLHRRPAGPGQPLGWPSKRPAGEEKINQTEMIFHFVAPPAA